jgi:hypothetical protein
MMVARGRRLDSSPSWRAVTGQSVARRQKDDMIVRHQGHERTGYHFGLLLVIGQIKQIARVQRVKQHQHGLANSL